MDPEISHIRTMSGRRVTRRFRASGIKSLLPLCIMRSERRRSKRLPSESALNRRLGLALSGSISSASSCLASRCSSSDICSKSLRLSTSRSEYEPD